MLNKNLVILSLSQIFSFTAAPITVFLSGIIGSQISPVKSLSTLPMSISVVGIASIHGKKVQKILYGVWLDVLLVILVQYFFFKYIKFHFLF